jgi:hypothetical protein
MEPESSLPCTQEPSTGPYPDPDQSSPHQAVLSLQDPSIFFSTAWKVKD